MDVALSGAQWLDVAQLAVTVVTALLVAFVALRVGRLATGKPSGAYQPHPIIQFLHREPVMVSQLVSTAAALAGGWGFEMSAQQIGVTVAFLNVLVGLFMRQVVTSPATVERSNLRYDATEKTLKRMPRASAAGVRSSRAGG